MDQLLNSSRISKLDPLLLSGNIRILFSRELLNEIQITITKPKLKKYFSLTAMEEMLLSLESYIDIVEVKSSLKICRDLKDNFLISLAKDGKADFLLSGDKDLLELEKYGRTQILTISAFLKRLKHYR